MKSVLIAAIFSITLIAPQQPPAPDDRRVQATADAIVQEGNTIHLRGHVEIRRGPSVVLADEADLPARVELNRDRPTIELRGSVQMLIEDVVPLTVTAR